ncbi:hypothetical protein HPP92_028501 [Vanilla planifolia]|uniref:B box-type domain-containing protein n=1 Tax=Vanilla planifolia TaxID=51239 RepID=A0A835P5S5_VANPL|nr:hypothetical protein HPP92_028501 [Vanilla planifolia]
MTAASFSNLSAVLFLLGFEILFSIDTRCARQRVLYKFLSCHPPAGGIMGSLCEFCGDQSSLVYCRSDAASLCLSCDRNVHSANALSRRHSRTLLCNRCYSHPATVRCIEESISLCHNCDWTGHGASASASGHKRQTISCYSGCPSSAELSRIWPFFLEFPPMTDPGREQGMCLMNINDNISGAYWGSTQNSSSTDILNLGRTCDLDNPNKQSVHIGSSASTSTPMICNVEQPTTPIGATTPKDIGMSKGDFYEFAVDDVDLTFEDYEELFGASHAHSEQLFDDVGIDSFFETRENSMTHSNGQAEFAAEVSSAGQVKSMQVACSNALSVDSTMSKRGLKTDSCLSIPARQARSSLSLSFSGLTGESCAGIIKIVACLQCFLWESHHGIHLVLRTQRRQLTGTMLSCVTKKRRKHANLRRK